MSWKPSSNHQWSFHYFPNQPILVINNHYYTICNSFPIFCTLQILMFKSTANCLENNFTAISNKNEQGSTYFKPPTMFYILTWRELTLTLPCSSIKGILQNLESFFLTYVFRKIQRRTNVNTDLLSRQTQHFNTMHSVLCLGNKSILTSTRDVT